MAEGNKYEPFSQSKPCWTASDLYPQKIKPSANFSSCPREVRNMIYRCSLVVSMELNPYPLPHERTVEYRQARAQYPSPALLALNKIYGQEARIVLYGDNSWRLGRAKEPPTIFFHYQHLFHNIVVAFSQGDTWGEAQIAQSLFWHRLPQIRSFNKYQWTLELHRQNRIRMVEDWIWKKQILHSMPKIRSITIHLRDFACPNGCCRLELLRQGGEFFERVLKTLSPRYLALTWPAIEERNRKREPEVIVRGLFNGEERSLMYEHYGFTAPDDELSSGNFLPTGQRSLIRP